MKAAKEEERAQMALKITNPCHTPDSNIGQQIRSLLLEDNTLSGRALALRVGCSPTTANKWKSRIEGELQAQSGENYGSASTE